jgi:hypothetical protein
MGGVMVRRIDERTAVARMMNLAVAKVPLEEEPLGQAVMRRIRRQASPSGTGRCKLCQLRSRPDLANAATVHEMVNRLLVRGHRQAAILRHIAPLMEGWPPGERPNKQNMSNHARQHLPWKDCVFEEAAERQVTDWFDGLMTELSGQPRTFPEKRRPSAR